MFLLGIGYNGVSKEGLVQWNRMNACNIFLVEFPTSARDVRCFTGLHLVFGVFAVCHTLHSSNFCADAE
jgi:hypothetical protein